MRLGIAFEGCAGRAAFHVGVVEWMLDNGYAPSAVAGASSGSIVAAGLAAGLGDRLTETWIRATDRKLFDIRRVLQWRWPFAMSDIVGDALAETIGDMRICDSVIPVAISVTTVDLSGRTRRMLTAADSCTLADAVLASCFMPGPYSRMVRIDGALTFDGAWQVRTPIDGLSGQILDCEIACVSNSRGLLKTGYPLAGSMTPTEKCRVLAPVEEITLGSYDLDADGVLRTIDIGRNSARRFFQTL